MKKQARISLVMAMAILAMSACSNDDSELSADLCRDIAKPDGAVSCLCKTGEWYCQFESGLPQESCEDVNRPQNAESCVCSDDQWYCTFPKEQEPSSDCIGIEKPENAASCICCDKQWFCTFPDLKVCIDENRPETAISCECEDGTWKCEFPQDDPCASKTCEANQHCDVYGECINDIDPCSLCTENQHCNESNQCVENEPKPECTNDSVCEIGKLCIDQTCMNPEEPGRLLSENVVKVYHRKSGDPIFARDLKIVDFSSSQFAENATTEFTKTGSKSLKWNYTQKDWSFTIPHNLTDYDAVSFWVYVPEEAVGQSAYMYFRSENDDTDGMDYYGMLIKFEKKGWMHVDKPLNKLSKSRTPLGWDNINYLFFTMNGWNQENSDKTTIYLDDIHLYSNHGDKIVDFSSSEYTANASTEYRNTGNKSLKWEYSKDNYKFKVPADLSGYKAVSFWVYVPEKSVGQTFYMYFSSDNPNTDKNDYYGSLIKLSASGWQYFNLSLSSFSKSHEPLGWDKINELVVTSKGWNQSNDTSTTIYLDDFYFSKDLLNVSQSTAIPNVSGAGVSPGGSRAIVDDWLINAAFDDDSSKVYIKDGEYWLPLTIFGARYDDKSRYNPKTHVLTMTVNGKKYRFIGGRNKVTINDSESELDFTPEVVGGAIFAPQKYIASLMGYTKEYKDEMGLLYLSKKDDLKLQTLTQRLNYMYETLFIRPTGAEIIARMNAHVGGDVHPRIMLTQPDFDRLKELLKTDETFKSYYNYLVTNYGPGSAQFDDAPVEYGLPDGVRLLSISREAKNRIIPWCFLYKLSGDSAYIFRIWREVMALCNFPDWHPAHYLDTAEILYPMAIAYDWLYDVWDGETKQIMEEKVLKYGLQSGIDRYEGKEHIWGANNWAGVCNGGLTSAALAYANAPITSAAAQKVLDYAMIDVEKGMFSYAPDGGYLESPSYWSYGSDYLHVMFSSLDSATGSMYGLYESPGFAPSAYFTTYLESEAGVWGFHDSGSGQTSTQIQPWFAKKSNNPSVGRIRYNAVANKVKSAHVYDLMWYAPEQIGPSVTLNLDAYYSATGTMTMRSTWEKGAILTGLHAGDNSASHGDLDNGNFIIYSGNKQFIQEMGSENYNVPKYFSTDRFTYYRKRAEGQNTLVIGDVDYKTTDQVKTAVGEFIRRESNEKSAIAQINLKPVYSNVQSGTRGLLFNQNRSVIVVQDELEMTTEQVVRWSAHTRGNIDIAANGRSAVIRLDKTTQHLYCEIVSSDSTLKFKQMDANSFDPNYPKQREGKEQEYDRSEYKKLVMITSDTAGKEKKVKNYNAAVVFKIVDDTAADPVVGKTYTWQAMADWKLD